jgi:hypothetical protein
VESNIPAKTPVSERVTTELREFAILAAYLYVCFTAFSYLKATILHDQGIAYAPWAIAAVKALIAAKFMLVGRALSVGERYKSYPLIVPTLYKSIAFLLFLIVLMVAEEAIVGFIHGRTFPESMTNVGGGALDQMVSISIVVLLIFVPYFAFRTLGDVIGERSLVRLFFERRRQRDDA